MNSHTEGIILSRRASIVIRNRTCPTTLYTPDKIGTGSEASYSSFLCVSGCFVTFGLSVFVPYLSFWSLGKSVLRNCGITWLSCLIFWPSKATC